MSLIKVSEKVFGTAESVPQFLTCLDKWQWNFGAPSQGFRGRVWYRGHSDSSYELKPSVYRERFTERAQTLHGSDIEEKRLNLEREMLSEFRVSGASFFDAKLFIELYFLARRHGMPSRLLDWTTNPLTALFFATAENKFDLDGEVIVMNPLDLLPPPQSENDFPKNILTMRHPYLIDMIGQSYWHEQKKKREPFIVPLCPDNDRGRIDRQSSCFTLHPHSSPSVETDSLIRITIPGGAKENILSELRKFNVNSFSILNDLGCLASEIARSWNIY